MKDVVGLPDQPAKQGKARELAPDRYVAYIEAAAEAARMLKSIYGAQGTKFKN